MDFEDFVRFRARDVYAAVRTNGDPERITKLDGSRHRFLAIAGSARPQRW
jgi:hypothetical protein